MNTTESGPESPTTVRPLEMDDDDVQETGILGEDGTIAKEATKDDIRASATASEPAAPPKPPRPLTEEQKNITTLKEAFPNVEETIVKAVLTASGGRIEPAFNALLGSSFALCGRREENQRHVLTLDRDD